MEKIKHFIREIYARFSRSNLGIRKKLLLGFLVIAVIPLIAIGVITYNAASNAMRAKAKSNLEAIGSTKATAIATFFDERRASMDVLREIVFTMQEKAFEKLVSVRENKIIWVQDYLLNRIGDAKTLSSNPTIAKALAAFEDSGAINSGKWKSAVERYGAWLTEYKETYGYFNMYLVSARGRVLYSVEQESDLGENLKTGRLKNSPAGKAFRKGLKGVSIQDFERYEPIGYLPVAFIAAPIRSGARVEGVIMCQIAPDSINAILQDRTGLSQTTEAFLVAKVGNGFELRSGRMVRGGEVGDPVTGPHLQMAVSGKAAYGYHINDRGSYMLHAFAPIEVPGLQWAIKVEADVEKIISPRFEQAEEDLFTYYKEGYGYFNFYLISPDGYLFYSVSHEKDYHTNLLTGPYKDSNLGRLVKRTLAARQVQLSDFEKYAPSQDTPAAFIALPIESDGQVSLIVAAQISTAQIQVILEDYTGLGKTGDTYLLGGDGLWRSESRFLNQLGVDSTVLNPRFAAPPDAIQSVLSGNADTTVMRNYRGDKVLSSRSIITVQAPSKHTPEGVKWAMFSEINLSELREPVMRMAWIWITVLGVTLVGVVMLSFVMAGGLTGQVKRIMNLFSNIGMGQFDARAEVISGDELGDMATSLNSMLDNTMSLIQSREERDAMQEAVMKLLSEISALTEGDLTARAEVTEQITGAIADSFNAMAEQLTRIVRGVKQATLQVGNTSDQVSNSTTTLAHMSEKQAKQVKKAIASINEITASIHQVAENAAKSAVVSKRSMASARKGAEAVGDTNIAMATIRERVQETARAIKRLGESSQEIGNITQIITDIADRTSILALNASIQAAMAGEAGRGFAVVAEEVQRLSERSTSSTKQIETLVQNIQRDINEAGKSMDESIQRVVEGSTLANEAHATLQEIESVSSQVAELIESISTVAKQQALTSETISKSMNEVGEISIKTSSATKHTALAMQTMAKTADGLRVSVEAFKISDRPDEDAMQDEDAVPPAGQTEVEPDAGSILAQQHQAPAGEADIIASETLH